MDLLMELQHTFQRQPFYAQYHECGGCRKRSFWLQILKCKDCPLYCHRRCLTPALTGESPNEDATRTSPQPEEAVADSSSVLGLEPMATAENFGPELDANQVSTTTESTGRDVEPIEVEALGGDDAQRPSSASAAAPYAVGEEYMYHRLSWNQDSLFRRSKKSQIIASRDRLFENNKRLLRMRLKKTQNDDRQQDEGATPGVDSEQREADHSSIEPEVGSDSRPPAPILSEIEPEFGSEPEPMAGPSSDCVVKVTNTPENATQCDGVVPASDEELLSAAEFESSPTFPAQFFGQNIATFPRGNPETPVHGTEDHLPSATTERRSDPANK